MTVAGRVGPYVDSMRETVEANLIDTCVVYEVAIVYDEKGKTEVFTPRDDPTPCRYATLSGREMVRAQQLAGSADTMVTLPALTEVAGSDRIVITDAETDEVYDVEVKHVVRRSQAAMRRVMCEDRTP